MIIEVYNQKKEKIKEVSSAFFDFLSNVKIDYSFLNRHFCKTKKEKHSVRLAHTKTISEVSGTTKKPHSQKGGGRSRQGSKRSAQHVGGGCVFGPKFHIRSININSKERSLAKIYAIADRFKNNSIYISDIDICSLKKTKDFVHFVANYDAKSLLFIDYSENKKNINPKFFSNYKYFRYSSVKNLTSFKDLASFEAIVINESCLNELILSITK